MPYDVWSGVCLSGLEVRLRRLNFDRDSSICLQVGDEDSRHEGVEIERSSPFHLSRILAKEFGYRSVSSDLDQQICVCKRSDELKLYCRLLKAVPAEAPGDEI